PIGIIWLVVVVRLVREYPIALRQILNKHKLEEVVLDLNDEATLAVLHQGLQSSYPGSVIYVLNLLEQFEYKALPDTLVRLLSHPSPEVRQEVLQQIERLDLKIALPAVRWRLETENVLTLQESCL